MHEDCRSKHSVGELGTVGELSGRDDTDVSHVVVIAHCIILIDGYDPSGFCACIFFFSFFYKGIFPIKLPCI